MKPYVLLMPTLNEGQTILAVMESVMLQTQRPSVFYIIDGGSTDHTVPLLRKYEENYPWVAVIQQTSFPGGPPGHEKISHAMVEIYRHMSALLFPHVDYIGHMDADMVLSPTTFEVLGDRIEQDNRIGAVGAELWTEGKPEVYPPDELPNIRLYRRAAIESIGGYPFSKYSWDSVILAKLRMAGWKIQQCPDASATNLRKNELSNGNKWRTGVEFGKARHYLGYSLPLFLAGVAYATKNIGALYGAGLMCGYFGDAFKPQTDDDVIRNYYRHERLKELIHA